MKLAQGRLGQMHATVGRRGSQVPGESGPQVPQDEDALQSVRAFLARRVTTVSLATAGRSESATSTAAKPPRLLALKTRRMRMSPTLSCRSRGTSAHPTDSSAGASVPSRLRSLPLTTRAAFGANFVLRQVTGVNQVNASTNQGEYFVEGHGSPQY